MAIEDEVLTEEEKRILKEVKKRDLNSSEVARIFKSVENSAPAQMQTFSDYFQKKERIGVFSDCHIGSYEFDEPFFKHMIKTFKKQGIKRVYNVGDTLEGMSGRDGHIYDLSEIGFKQQFNKAIRLFKLFPKDIKIFGIDGNHDEWYQKKGNMGLIVGQELASRIPNYHYLGQDEANIELRKGITMKLIHPGDGTAYALSYKIQRRIESFSGGEKPNILLEGHYHKSLYLFYRNVHAIECGTMCGQTSWMRAKNIPAMKGFWIIDMELGRGGIGKFQPSFYPGYK